jgi:hypothetical protein
LSFFQKIKELFQAPPPRNPHGDWFYYSKIFSRKLLVLYKSVIEQSKQGTVLKTGEDIVPPELAFGFSTAAVIEKWGKPRCTFDNKKAGNNIRIFFYRRDFIYENTLFQLQFHNDQLFFVCLEVGKSLATEESKIAILANMLPSHVTSNFKTAQSIPTMQDIHGNFLVIQDDVLLDICYLSGNYANDKLSILEEAKKNNPQNSDEG